MKLNKKIFLYFFSIFFLLLSVISIFQFKREKSFRTEELDQKLRTYNHLVDKFTNTKKRNWEELNQFVALFPDTALRITVIDTAGTVIYDSFVPKSKKLENHINRPEIQQALKIGIGKAIRHSITTNRDYYYLANHFKTGYVRSALPYNVSLRELLRANTHFLYFIFFVLILAFLAMFFISRNFTRSIDRLRVFAQKAENEELLDTDILFPKDELGEISNNVVQLYKLLLKTKDEVYKEREKLFKHLQISQEGLGIFSSDKKEILANTHFIQYTNILSDQHEKLSDQIFCLPEFSEINDFIDQSLLNNEMNRKRIVINKDGRVFSVQCIVFQDDTFEISINDTSIQEHENQLKRQLTENISHELKTPVSSILGYMESILENPNLDPQRQLFFIERSFQQAQRLSALLQDITTLNNMDEANRLFEKDPCSLGNVIQDVLNDLQLEIEQKNCTVVKNNLSDLEVMGNRSLLYSIFRNLMDNALAYAGENLILDINCYREDAYFYYFSFSDNGIGVGEKHLSRLFDRFYRVDKGRSRKMGGTGLGLAIVKNAVLFHRGSILAKNLPNGGLSFIFSIRKH
jgi:signal transduction histidine kinase/HAMP domain-containing protein